jgi:hypothetical protein
MIDNRPKILLHFLGVGKRFLLGERIDIRPHIMDETNTPPAFSSDSCCEKPCCKPKCCWPLAAICIAAIVGVSWLGVLSRHRHNEIAGPPLLKAEGKDLKATVITPSVDTPIEPGKNVLWCSTFQLVWNEGCRYAGGDIHLKDEPPMVAALNKKLGDEKDVDANSCLVMSGMVEDGIVNKIRQELDRKFQGQADPDLLKSIESQLPSNGWLAYAYLFRSLPFEHKFKRLTEPLEFGSAKVASFGLRNIGHDRDDHRIAEQVAVLDYKNDDNFVLALLPKDRSEWIVLAKIVPAETLQKTIETVRSRAANWIDPQKAESIGHWKQLQEQSLEDHESVVVPVLNFELLKSYDELVGKTITTPGPRLGMPIVLAMQSIRFRLDENGAVLKSEAATKDSKKADGKPRKPRQFIFDKPFLILLERKDAAQPYFALWVDNPELLVPFK